MVPFGDTLKKIRTQKNISQGELAKMVDMHATHISRYERNLTAPSIEVLKKLAAALDVSTDVLLYGTEEEQVKENLKDTELLNMFKKVQVLDQQDVSCIKNMLNAYIIKTDLQQKLAQ